LSGSTVKKSEAMLLLQRIKHAECPYAAALYRHGLSCSCCWRRRSILHSTGRCVRQPIGGVQTRPAQSGESGARDETRRAELIVAPIPFSGLGVGGSFNLAEDRYRFTFLTGAARARYEFFGIGNSAGSDGRSIWLSQHGHAVFVQGLRRIGWHIFVGPRFSHRTIKADHEAAPPQEGWPELPQLPPISDQLNLSLTTAALGFRVQRDTRDSMFYPTRGVRMDARVDFFGPYVGSKFTFQNYMFEMNKYVPLRKRHVVALRAMGCGVVGEQIPFYELCQFGMMGDLRGYQAGRYRDRAMFATQSEWRVFLPWRLGATVFGGVGEVAPDGKSFNTEDLLPSGGAGPRFNLSKQRRINLRLDLAYSRREVRGQWA
jgi:outer membrane protein assembly factor BamA